MLGVRGSTAAPGPEFVRYGGHTSCVAITASGSDRPTLVLDAGTGLRCLTAMLAGGPFVGTILLSHLHWDHMQGLPFCAAGDRADAAVSLFLPAQDGRSALDLLTQCMSPPGFPITPSGLQGHWAFHALEPGTSTVEGFAVTAAEVRHKGGRTFGYRVSDGAHDLAYLPDHVAAGEVTPGLERLVRGADVLLHDAQFLEAERTMADAYGHSTVDDAVALAEKLDVRTLVLFHHGPARTDDQLDAIVAGLADLPLTVVAAVEGQSIDLPVG
jgi:phosphoribosyl 1,2-cyclic phosphodiesterase